MVPVTRFLVIGMLHVSSSVNESLARRRSCSLFKHSINCINSELCTLGIAAAGAIGKSIGATEASAKPEEEEKCALNSC